jgi:GNAT superfamily N-acetyltransferase
VTFRALAPEDEAALTALARACDETYLSWAPKGWTVPAPPPGWAAKYFRPDAYTEGAFEADELIATVAFRPADAGPSIAHLGLVFVHPSRWRRGIAGTMLGRAEAEMVARGFTSEQLWTPDGAPAEHFYRARGWARDGRTEWHPWVGLQMVGYARTLP